MEYLKIPIEILNTKKLTVCQLVLLAFYLQESEEKGYCDLLYREMTQRLPYHQATIEKQTTKLEKLGFVRKEYSDASKRGKKVYITEKYKKFIA